MNEQPSDTVADDIPGNDAPAKTPFNLKKHLIRIKGGGEYLPVNARVVWFRQDHPDWSITTTLVEYNMNPGPGLIPYAIFQATILNAEGNIIAMGTKHENQKGFGDFLEKAETGAIGRALAFSGYGTLFAPELLEGERIVDGPRNQTQEAHGEPERVQNRNPSQNRGTRPVAGQQSRRQNDEEGHVPERENAGMREPEPVPMPEGVITEEERTARQDAYNSFADIAFRLGFDVTIKSKGESIFSYMKVGGLIVSSTASVRPTEYRGWLPQVDLLETAKLRLVDLVKESKVLPPDFEGTPEDAARFVQEQYAPV